MRITSKFKAIIITITVLALSFTAIAAIDTITGSRASAGAAAGQISKLRKEKAEYERRKKEINSRIETLEFEHMEELDKKKILDERIILTGKEIDNLREIINQYTLMVSEKEYEAIIAQNREEEQLNKYKSRVRYLEENGIVSYLTIILESTSILDFLASIDFVNNIITADEEAYISLQQARETTMAARDELEDIKAELDDEYEKMDGLKKELDEQLEESHALILKMEADLELERLLYDKVSEEESRVQRQIYAYEAEQRRQRELERAKAQQEQQQQAEQQSSSQGNQQNAATGTGELMWPLQGQVISNFGMRGGRMHQGIDIGAAHGTAIVAADGGTVITSSYGSGYGNYVVISHGNGTTTLYAHNSTNLVAVGAAVSKGQQIATVGSTGNATTPHLHFEVSVNGTRVNPITKL